MSLDPSRQMPRDDRQWFEWCNSQRTWTLLPKILTQTKQSDTTYADDDELVIPVKPSEVILLRCEVFFDTGATPDFKFQITGPTSPTEVVIRGSYTAVGTTNATDFVDTSLPTSHAVTGTGGTTGGHARFSMLLQNGANTGNIALQWAQNTSDASDTSVLVGSFFEYLRL